MSQQNQESPTDDNPVYTMAINFLLITIGCGLALAGLVSAASMLFGGAIDVLNVSAVVLGFPGAYILFRTMSDVVVGTSNK